MLRWIPCIPGLLLLCACDGPMDEPIRSAPDAAEVGNGTFVTADVLNLNPADPPQTVNGTVVAEDLDYYKLVVPRGDNGLLRVQMSGLSANLDMTLYNSYRTTIGDSDNAGTANETLTLYRGADEDNDIHYQAEEFFIKVFSLAGESSPYVLEVSFGHDTQ